jgi:hypothetical protein
VYRTEREARQRRIRLVEVAEGLVEETQVPSGERGVVKSSSPLDAVLVLMAAALHVRGGAPGRSGLRQPSGQFLPLRQPLQQWSAQVAAAECGGRVESRAGGGGRRPAQRNGSFGAPAARPLE